MEIYERVHHLRKHVLKMTMDAFGKELGVSRSVIVNIEGNKLARPDQKLSLMKLICEKFNVREEWLLNGEEPMFKSEKETFDLNKLLIKEGVKAEDIDFFKSFIHTYLDLKPETRKMVKGMMIACAENKEERER